MPDCPHDLCLTARFDNLAALMSGLSSRAGHTQAHERTLLRAQVVVEELFANTIHHGYGQECDQPVWLGVCWQDGHLLVSYADAAPVYDPLSNLNALPAGESPRLGGAGRHLVAELPDAANHCYRNGRNEVSCRFDLRV